MDEETLIPSDLTPSDPLPTDPDTPIDFAVMEIEHTKWLESEGKEGKRANMRGRNLTGVDLSGRSFVEASLRGAILTGANLSGIDLRAADLAEARLDDANLSGAKLAGASFARAQLHRTNLSGADLVAANFTAAISEGIDLTDAKLDGAILRDANFRQGHFTRASLQDANLRGITAVDADFGAVNLASADCRDANFDRCRFKDSILNGTNFRGAKMGGVDLHASDFSVALDVAAEVIAQSTQAEQGRIASLRAELESREQTLAAQKEMLETEAAHVSALQAMQAEHAGRLSSYSKQLVLYAILWIFFAAVVIALTLNVASQLQHMKMERVLPIIGMVVFAVGLAFFSMLRSFQVTRLVKKAVAMSLAHPLTLGGDASGAEPASTDATAAPKKKGLGFGKKK